MEIKWRKAFMEVALRAFRKLHVEYGMWGVGQASNKILHWENLNTGPGVELAPETAVCSAISQEFINSPFTNGAYIEPKYEEPRRYEINREVKLNNERIDLFINRYMQSKKSKEIVFYKFPVIIEAKRIHYFTPNISIGDRGKPKEKITGENGLKEDLEKLLSYRKSIAIDKNYKISAHGYEKQTSENSLKDAFLYLLYWGVYEQDSEIHTLKKTPFELTNEISEGLVKPENKDNYELRWMPLKWSKDESPPRIIEWLWIMLVEIKHEEIGKPSIIDEENWFQKK